MRYDQLLAVLGSSWAILPEMFSAMVDAVGVMVAGGAPDLDKIASASGRKPLTLLTGKNASTALAAMAEKEAREALDILGASGSTDGSEDLPYDLQDGIAVITVTGTLVKRNSLFSCFSTYAEARDAITQALDDSRVKAILLLVDSPGGTVDGCMELAEFVADADAVKPVYAYADGQMTSAAYWLSSGASEIAAPPSAYVGSIGVLSMHTDRSGQDKQRGVARTYITAGKFKAAGHDAAPLADTDRQIIQDRLDATYALFLDGVAANRGLDTANAADWADGKVFLAQGAKDAGLIDHVMNLDAFMGRIREQMAKGQTNKEGQTMLDLTKFKAENPDLVRELRAEFQAEAEAKAKAEGADKPGPDVGKVTAEAAASGTRKVLAVAESMFGKDVATSLRGQVEALDKAGVSPEQLSALAEAGFIAQPKAEGQEGGGKSKRDEMLQAISAAGAKNVDPAKPGEAKDAERKGIIGAMAAGLKGVK